MKIYYLLLIVVAIIFNGCKQEDTYHSSVIEFNYGTERYGTTIIIGSDTNAVDIRYITTTPRQNFNGEDYPKEFNEAIMLGTVRKFYIPISMEKKIIKFMDDFFALEDGYNLEGYWDTGFVFEKVNTGGIARYYISDKNGEGEEKGIAFYGGIKKIIQKYDCSQYSQYEKQQFLKNLKYMFVERQNYFSDTSPEAKRLLLKVFLKKFLSAEDYKTILDIVDLDSIRIIDRNAVY